MHTASPESKTTTVATTPDSGAVTTAAPLSDPHLQHLTALRQQAAQACTRASQAAQEANQVLSDYLAKRLRAGASYTQLRGTLLAAGINHNSVTRLMRSSPAVARLPPPPSSQLDMFPGEG